MWANGDAGIALAAFLGCHLLLRMFENICTRKNSRRGLIALLILAGLISISFRLVYEWRILAPTYANAGLSVIVMFYFPLRFSTIFRTKR